MNVKSHLAFPSRLPNQRDKIASFHLSTFSWMFSKGIKKVKTEGNRQKLFYEFHVDT